MTCFMLVLAAGALVGVIAYVAERARARELARTWTAGFDAGAALVAKRAQQIIDDEIDAVRRTDVVHVVMSNATLDRVARPQNADQQ
jgi:hypothetical protein